jgi:DegV family protein with EDD domain
VTRELEVSGTMGHVRIVTDITAHLGPEVAEQHRITIVPVEIRFGEHKFLIDSQEAWDAFFQHISGGKAKPVEASVPESVFQQAFGRLNRETEEILVIPSSSKLSGAYVQAQRAARSFLGRCRIAVMDSLSASWGLGLIVEAAAVAAAEGFTLDQVVRRVRGMLPHVYLVSIVERLDYLEQGRRISAGQALLGTLLRIKPFLLMEDGDIMPLEKVRTREMAVDKLVDFVAEFASVQQATIVKSPLDGELYDLVGELREHLSLVLPDQEIPIIDYDPVLACHLGPEALGVIVHEGALD